MSVILTFDLDPLVSLTHVNKFDLYHSEQMILMSYKGNFILCLARSLTILQSYHDP